MYTKASFFFLAIILFSPAYSHPGNTAADGCHHCWTNCNSWGREYGARHCHNGYESNQRIEIFQPESPQKENREVSQNLEGKWEKIDEGFERVIRLFSIKSSGGYDRIQITCRFGKYYSYESVIDGIEERFLNDAKIRDMIDLLTYSLSGEQLAQFKESITWCRSFSSGS